MAKHEAARISALNLTIVLALCFGSLTYGYSFSVAATTLGQAPFYAYFGLTTDPTSDRYAFTNRIIGGLNGCYSAGGVIGSLLAGWSCDALGRKKTLYLATPIGVIGGAFQGGAAHLAMLLLGRALTGISVGILMVLIPMFQCEISPPAQRGFLVSQHGVILVLGYALAGWIGFGCSYTTNAAFQWRFPLCVQALWPLIMFLLIPFIPESPRWLLMKDRRDSAWEVINLLHNTDKDSDSHHISFAREEFYQMSHQVSADLQISRTETLSTLFTKPSYRKRMFCAFMTMFATESTGILVIYNYSVILYTGLGLSNKISLLLAAVFVTIACIGNGVNALLIDHFGRKVLLVAGIAGSLITLIIEAAMTARYSGTDNKAGLKTGVVFLFLYIACYASTLDATSYVFCTEIFPTHLRARGMAWSLAILFLCTIAYLIPAPTAFAQVGWKYYLLFIVLSTINLPLIWYFFPETRGLALEEVGEIFGDKIEVRLTHLTAEQREALDKDIEAEKETVELEHVDQVAK
ncbi:hypothetical protein AYO21_12057 [Fonsecaea monophora]|uniref:Major facilitator superfamily (MFS) profile domain-containing protein n=1 Tax=Fonsecaea monophora TaxID=254056 RepID=A0A177EPI3_9EURO|nr:hypothetical protein AYO21_12057 [Fonsecaea monophora]OAG33838.1 hypothetical protein AYO21_12057 [Fonsecaea monophora]